MSRLPHRRPRPTPFHDAEARRLLREAELAQDRLYRIRTDALTRMGRV